MNIEDLMDMVASDVAKPIRRDMCDWEASRIPTLHDKYRKILYFEKVELERMKAGLLPLIRKKRKYYKDGPANKEEEKKEGPFGERLIGKFNIGTDPTSKSKKEKQMIEVVELYVESDPDMIAARELVTKQAEKVEYLKDTLEELRKKSFHLSNIINTQRFKHGLDKMKEVIDMSEPED